MEGTIAEIRYFAGNFAPRNWAFCDGQILSVNSNQALFSLIGTLYGGDGTTSFALPDLRGRSPVSPGRGPGLFSVQAGQRGGTEQISLTPANLPNHSHAFALNASSDAGTTPDPTGNFLGNAARFDNDFVDGAADPAPALVEMAGGGQTGATGGSQPFSSRNPYLGVYAIICLFGTFPSRS